MLLFRLHAFWDIKTPFLICSFNRVCSFYHICLHIYRHTHGICYSRFAKTVYPWAITFLQYKEEPSENVYPFGGTPCYNSVVYLAIGAALMEILRVPSSELRITGGRLWWRWDTGVLDRRSLHRRSLQQIWNYSTLS